MKSSLAALFFLSLLLGSQPALVGQPLSDSGGFAPPDVPPRPELPVMPAVAPTVLSTGKPPLAWRVKAHELRMSRQRPQATTEGRLDEIVMSLAASAQKCGYRVDTLNLQAGEMLAVKSESSPQEKLIFVFAEPAPQLIAIRAAAIPQSKQSLETIKSLLEGLSKPDPTRISF